MQLVTGFANKHVLDDGHGRRNGKTWAGVQLYVIIFLYKYYVLAWYHSLWVDSTSRSMFKPSQTTLTMFNI